METLASSRKIITASIIVAALGYFVDIYDLILFSIVRVPSLTALGVVGDAAILSKGVLLLNMQMGGMLVGGILWGILGDKRGRLSVLFGSIFLYSLANIANGFVQSVEMYALLRVIAGIGLAGELGAGITLVSEIMPRESRGYGTMTVAAVGILGAVVASLVGASNWRTAYFVGGGMGLALLILRISVYESGMFNSLRQTAVARGNFWSLFTSKERLRKYLGCIFIGIPLWYVVGILMTFSPETGKALGMTTLPTGGKAIMYCYIGLAAGDFMAGMLSQFFKTRLKVVLFSVIATAVLIAVYCFSSGISIGGFYALCVALGLSCGYWAIFVTIASEQFGTNIRATVTTTVPNFVRGAVVPLTLLFQWGRDSLGTIGSAGAVGAFSVVLALVALSQLSETYGKDLDYVEDALTNSSRAMQGT